jgi:hypothetical protein
MERTENVDDVRHCRLGVECRSYEFEPHDEVGMVMNPVRFTQRFSMQRFFILEQFARRW